MGESSIFMSERNSKTKMLENRCPGCHSTTLMYYGFMYLITLPTILDLEHFHSILAPVIVISITRLRPHEKDAITVWYGQHSFLVPSGSVLPNIDTIFVLTCPQSLLQFCPTGNYLFYITSFHDPLIPIMDLKWYATVLEGLLSATDIHLRSWGSDSVPQNFLMHYKEGEKIFKSR